MIRFRQVVSACAGLVIDVVFRLRDDYGLT